jgi:glycosyltransferase involved in cell wall biosynthesis
MKFVTVIIPCLNEEKTIGKVLVALLAQSYPLSQFEVVIADGMSTDSTRQVVAAFQDSHPGLDVRVVDNPARTIPAGLNLAIRAGRGDVIVRLDGHSIPAHTYIECSVRILEQGRASNVGGVWQIEPGTPGWLAHSIAAAAAHPLGVGDALYRYTGRALAVDTVPFGAFYRSLLDKIGYYDESLLTNEDYEFNTRIRQAGGTVWLDPSIRSVYFARSTLRDLARQYFRYGYWKYRMLLRYPATIRWRQGLPPLFVLSLVVLLLVSLIWAPAGGLLLAEAILYLGALLSAGFLAARKTGKWFLIFGLPLAIACMHLSWGAGFLTSMVKSWVR